VKARFRVRLPPPVKARFATAATAATGDRRDR
jgi:hypothetical protein